MAIIVHSHQRRKLVDNIATDDEDLSEYITDRLALARWIALAKHADPNLGKRLLAQTG